MQMETTDGDGEELQLDSESETGNPVAESRTLEILGQL